jgi:hypothetical protein
MLRYLDRTTQVRWLAEAYISGCDLDQTGFVNLLDGFSQY